MRGGAALELFWAGLLKGWQRGRARKKKKKLVGEEEPNTNRIYKGVIQKKRSAG